MRFEHGGAAAKKVHGVGELVTLGEARAAVAIPFLGGVGLLVDGTGDDSHPRGVAALGDFDRLGHRGEDLLVVLGAAVHERGGIETGVGDKHAHLHVEIGEGFADGLLFFRGTAGHAVVFPGGETMVGGELDLIDDTLACVRLEHPGMRSVTQIEFRFHGRGRLPEKVGRVGEEGGAGNSRGVEKSATIHDGD